MGPKMPAQFANVWKQIILECPMEETWNTYCNIVEFSIPLTMSIVLKLEQELNFHMFKHIPKQSKRVPNLLQNNAIIIREKANMPDFESF